MTNCGKWQAESFRLPGTFGGRLSWDEISYALCPPHSVGPTAKCCDFAVTAPMPRLDGRDSAVLQHFVVEKRASLDAIRAEDDLATLAPQGLSRSLEKNIMEGIARLRWGKPGLRSKRRTGWGPTSGSLRVVGRRPTEGEALISCYLRCKSERPTKAEKILR